MRTIVNIRFGSHLYGTATPQSDLDFKAVHIPAAGDILLQRAASALTTMRRRLLLTTALVPLALALAPDRAAARQLVPEFDADGRVVAWVNPPVLARLRQRLAK